MLLESQDLISEPVDKVYETVRDRLNELVPFMPNIEKIAVESREEKPEGAYLINRWYAQVDVPGMLKKVLKPEFFSWVDHAQWNDGQKEVTYQLVSTLTKDLFEAKGHNYFIDQGGKTLLKVTCEVNIYPERVPGVPKLLAGKIRPAIESLMKKMLEPNLTSLAKGLQEYFAH